MSKIKFWEGIKKFPYHIARGRFLIYLIGNILSAALAVFIYFLANIILGKKLMSHNTGYETERTVRVRN